MAKKKGSSKKYTAGSDYNSGYYEPFAGYYNSDKDQEVYWNMVKSSKGVIPKQFMEMDLPMADDIGIKGQPKPKFGTGK